ncbi:MAG: amino acid adenylation domain-containing protein [Moorea sp. SIO4A3]|nr:amino acid adenylation domain-containing protein [Moorena sp. SIO4A3]
MRPIQDFLAELNALDINLWVDPNNNNPQTDLGQVRLRCNAPKGVLTPVLKEQLSARKAEIIAYLQQHSQTKPDSLSGTVGIGPKLLPVARTGLIPLSFAQQRLWFLDQLESGLSTDYNVPSPLELKGPLNVSALEQTLQEIVRRHEILRTNIQVIEGEVQQVIHAELPLQFPLVDLQYLNEPAQTAEVQKLLIKDEQTLFNLARDPLMRVTLVRLSPQHHILLLNFHHIVFDGWSAGVFMQEFAELYQAFCAGQPPLLPPLPIQYADYAIWQRQWLQGAELDRQLQYWQQQFAELPPSLELPSIQSYKPGEPVQGCRETFEIAPELTEKLRQLSRSVGATLFMTVLAAYTVLLYRYSAQEDLTIGVPLAGRNRKQIEPLIGFFVNTLALRFNLEGNPSFRTLVGRVRRQVLDAQDHQDLPFEKLVEVLQPDRDRSHSPLFRVMFVLQRETISQQQLGELTVKDLPTTQATETFDLTLFVTEREQKLHCIWEYDGNRFDEIAMARMTGHFQTLLQGICAHPDQPIGQLPLLTAAERQQFLSWGLGTILPFQSKPTLVTTLFEACVQATPDAIALQFGDRQLTYRALNDQANQLGHYLQNQGVGPEILVGLCVERSLEMVVGLLGILKAGGAYVPIDPDYPSDRITYIIQDTQVALVLSQAALAPKLSQAEVTCVLLDTDWEIIGQQPRESPVNRVKGNNLAYVIYTSGSTGQPKGVAIEHCSLASFTESAIAAYDITARDRILQFASISFDTAVEEIYPCLCTGATLVFRTEEMIASSAQFWQLCQDWELTVLDLPTAYWHLLTADLTPESLLPPRLRLVIIGGEQALLSYWQQWQQWLRAQESQYPQHTVPQLVNTYGPTETTVVATLYRFPTPTDPSANSLTNIPIGRPLGQTQVYILDKQLQPVPVGIPGELHIGGPGLTRGYLNRADLTTEGFIPNPFADDKSKLYKTGDRVRYLPDGNLEYLGRIDNQVKLRGFRIELGEIEAAIVEHPDISEVAVQLTGVSPQQRLVAYIVPHTIAISHRQLREFLKQKLPSYMIPSRWISLENLPRSVNGKVDRRALPSPSANQQQDRSRHLPHNRIELELVKIWSEVLDLNSIGVQDNFFELGGHSLLGVSLMAKILQTFGRSLPLGTLFQDGTIEQQALLLKEDHPIEWSPIVPFRVTGNQSPLFCVHAGGGSAFVYTQLANYLDADQPLYGIDARGLQEGEPHDRVEEMASYYLEALQAIQPQSPYHLLGWCFGGLVAFEIAQQLQRQGQTVAFLGLLDIPDYFTLKDQKFPELPDDDALQFIAMFDKDLVYCKQSLQTLPPTEHFPYVLEEAKRLNFIPATFGIPEALNLIKVSKAHKQAIEHYSYQMQQYPDTITLLQARNGIAEDFEHPLQGWSQLAKTIKFHWIPGNHYNILLPPHVQFLGTTIQRCLANGNHNH